MTVFTHHGIYWFLWGFKPVLPFSCRSFSGKELQPPILSPSFSTCFWPPPSACCLFFGKELFSCLFCHCPFPACFSVTSLALLSIYDDFISSIWIVGSPHFVWNFQILVLRSELTLDLLKLMGVPALSSLQYSPISPRSLSCLQNICLKLPNVVLKKLGTCLLCLP